MVNSVNQTSLSNLSDRTVDSIESTQKAGQSNKFMQERNQEVQNKNINPATKLPKTAKSQESQEEKEENVVLKSRKKLEEIQQALNETLKDINIGLDFEKNDELEEMVIKVMNRETNELIRQIPPEAMIKMAKRMEEMTGILVDVWR